MSKAFAWIMAILSIGFLSLQLLSSAPVKLPVVIFWALVLALSAYVLFLRKPRAGAPK